MSEDAGNSWWRTGVVKRGMVGTRTGYLWVTCAALLWSAVGCAAQTGAGPDSAPPEPVLAAGDHEIRLRHDGRNRRYFVRIPETSGVRPAVVMGLHGGGGNASGFKDDYGFDAIADREGFIAVYPDGTGPLPNRLLTWHGGDNCCGYARQHEVDDVGFLLAVLDDLAAKVRYDDRRVYVTGHSNGAMMSYHLAASAPERIAAIVPVAGAMWIGDRPTTAIGVPVLHIHSLDDPRALYGGGSGPPFPGTDTRIDHMPVEAGLDFWVEANGCASDPTVLATREGMDSNLGQRLMHLRWTGCTDGAVVEHIRLKGVGHGWPGAKVGRWVQRILGPPTTMIHASEAAWEFASRHRR